MKKLLIFGGTFDPPHQAHASLPPLVARELECDRVLYVPAAVSPLKTDQEVTASEERLAMLWIAIAGVPEADISTIELDRPGPSYTITTLRALRDVYPPDCEFFLLMGADQALDFHLWKDWEEILTLATPAVMLRAPEDEESFQAKLAARYEPIEVDRWMSWTVPVPRVDVSSTEVRRRLAAGEPTSGMLHPAVSAYIDREGLYAAEGGPGG